MSEPFSHRARVLIVALIFVGCQSVMGLRVVFGKVLGPSFVTLEDSKSVPSHPCHSSSKQPSKQDGQPKKSPQEIQPCCTHDFVATETVVLHDDLNSISVGHSFVDYQSNIFNQAFRFGPFRQFKNRSFVWLKFFPFCV